jgi:dTDP-4-dehydrorhamnose reductase
MEIVSDTLYTPTDARELAKAILLATERVIEDPSVSGTYHFAGPDVMSYLDFARLVQEEAGLDALLTPTTALERERIEGVKRPKNAALNSDKFAEVFGLRHRPTRECVRELVNPAA